MPPIKEPVELKAGEITLLPCPGCGNQPWDTPQNGSVACPSAPSGYLVSVHCGCGFDGPHRPTDAEAIAAWNHRIAHSAPPREPTRETFQDRVQPWMMECFGPEISADRVERCDRFIEEALELVQASGYEKDRAHALVEYVYGRDPGEVNQEVGGVMVTLAAHCLAFGVDMHKAGETELARIWTNVEVIRAKQAAKPKHSPLPFATPQPDSLAVGEEECAHGWADWCPVTAQPAASCRLSRPASSLDREATIEECARVAEAAPMEMLYFWERPGGPPGNGYRATTPKDIAAMIRALAASPGAMAGGRSA